MNEFQKKQIEIMMFSFVTVRDGYNVSKIFMEFCR